MTLASDLPYRPCVGAMVLNRDGLVWIGRRVPENNAEHVDVGYEWQMPQGGIDPGEDPLTAVKRELCEETGITSIELLAEAPEWFFYDIPPEIIGRKWRAKWRGQRQKWFAFRFVGDEDEIRIHDPPGGHEPEFAAWRWEVMDRLPSLIIPFKRKVYEQVVAAFRGLGASGGGKG